MEKPIIVANWKMNGSKEMAKALLYDILSKKSKAPWVCCPPATLLDFIHGFAPDLVLGGQDCGIKNEGAFTGSIASSHLKEAGASFVIVGHSERRKFQYETNADVALKAKNAIESGLIPIICIGESFENYESGETLNVLDQQLAESSQDIASGYILAYEPIWAIGSGKTPALEEIQTIHNYLKSKKSHIQILYGGSANAKNAADILAIENVDGLLVGGASLKAEDFTQILTAAKAIG
jgi:triosephosphate isomerase